jgi:antitoxin ParD1/3/4
MAQMTVLLPDDLQHWTDARAAEGGFDSGGDYVRDLVRRDREYAEKLAALRAAIEEGLASGVSERDPFEYLEELRAGLRERARSADAA